MQRGVPTWVLLLSKGGVVGLGGVIFLALVGVISWLCRLKSWLIYSLRLLCTVLLGGAGVGRRGWLAHGKAHVRGRVGPIGGVRVRGTNRRWLLVIGGVGRVL